MRGYDPVEVAAEALSEAARRYAGAYLLAPFSMESADMAEQLRIAAVAYAEATRPKKRAAKAAEKGSTER